MILTKRHYFAVGGLVLLAVVFGIAAAAVPKHASADSSLVVPEHTLLRVTLDQSLSSRQSRPGDHFDATINEPVMVGDKMAIPQGAHAQGVVVDARPSGRLMGRARLQLALETVEVDGTTYDLHTSTTHRAGGSHKNRNLGWIGGGAASGAVIGAIAAGGEGALIGGPIGAGAGTAVAFATGHKNINLPAETVLSFKLTQPVTIGAKS